VHLDEVLNDDAGAVADRSAAPTEDYPDVLPASLRDVARAREGGLAALAEAAQLNREHLDRMVPKNGNPGFDDLATG